MCDKKIHQLITEDGPVCHFGIKSVAELSRISQIDQRVLYKRLERLGKGRKVSIDLFLRPPKSMKYFRPPTRVLTIAKQCRQAGVKQVTYWRRRRQGASHKQALGIDFMLDRRYKLKYLPPEMKPKIYYEKPDLFCFGIKFDSFEEIAYLFNVNKTRIERLFKRGLSIEEAIAHRDAKNTGIINFSRLEQSEHLRNQSAKLYLAILYIDGRKLLKVGYTTRSIAGRLNLISRNYKILFEASDTLYEIFKAEQFILESVMDRGYNSCELDVDGRSEIYEYSGHLENLIWGYLDLIFEREKVDQYIDFNW